MKKHFVTFYSPGTFVAEMTTKEIGSWDVEKALEMMDHITERYDAIPYGFVFTTRARTGEEFEPKEVSRSGIYYVDCKVTTLAELEAAPLKSNKILRENMRSNGWDKVATTKSGWAWSQPLRERDIVL